MDGRTPIYYERVVDTVRVITTVRLRLWFQIEVQSRPNVKPARRQSGVKIEAGQAMALR